MDETGHTDQIRRVEVFHSLPRRRSGRREREEVPEVTVQLRKGRLTRRSYRVVRVGCGRGSACPLTATAMGNRHLDNPHRSGHLPG
jgi:hypothetical protein